jgi:RNA polymerase sigma factor (sigma-70 family)
MHPDNRYIDGLKQNNSAVITEIYANHAAKIERMVLTNNGTEADAADVFQEALTDLYRKAHGGFVLTCPLDAFLYMICKNKWINLLNKRKRSPVTFTDTAGYSAGEDVFKNAELMARHGEKQQLVEEQLAKLGDSCRQLIAHWQKGIPLEEVAGLMGTTYGYIRKKKSECMAKLIELVKNSPAYKLLMS